MKNHIICSLLCLMFLNSCVTVNDGPKPIAMPEPPQIVTIKGDADCVELADDFTIKMSEAGLEINREDSGTAYIQEAQQGGKYYVLVIKEPNDESWEWTSLLDGYKFSCKYKGQVVLDVILKQ